MKVTARKASELSDAGIAFQNPGAYEKTMGWLDQSLTWVIPTTGWFHADVVDSWETIDWPMNQPHSGRHRANGMEVGEAYNYLFRLATDREFARENYERGYADFITGTRFVFTTEQDNIIPSNAVTALMAAIYTCPDCGEPIGRKLIRVRETKRVPVMDRSSVWWVLFPTFLTLWRRFFPKASFIETPDIVTRYEQDAELLENWQCANGHRGYDAVSGLYYTKSLPPRPMAYGNPSIPDDYTPQSVEEHVRAGSTMEVNGIAMGCAIWRKGLFAHVSEPWFVTSEQNHATGSAGGNQDLYFCGKAKHEAGARFGVHCGVRVGHVDKSGRRF